MIVIVSASCIGLAIARKFYESNAQVYICDISVGATQVATSDFPGLNVVVADVGIQSNC